MPLNQTALQRNLLSKVFREFHVSRRARDLYEFEDGLFATNGNVIFADFRSARSFAQKMNAKRDLITHPEQAIRAGQINAMGLIDEILHQVVAEYRRQINPEAFAKALAWINEKLAETRVNGAFEQFVDLFPPLDVQRGQISVQDYLGRFQLEFGRAASAREAVLEELLFLWLANENPAFRQFRELFDDTELKKLTIYPEITPELYRFFQTQPRFGPDHENLIDLLQAPAKKYPHSLSAQLEFMLKNWGGMIPAIVVRLLSSLDMIREEEKPIFGVGGQSQTPVYEFLGPEYEIEEERFSQDLYWMPNLVLLAKNVYVWLDQLARKYSKEINRLDQVPDDELEMLSRQGFTGLWLIGLWERSRASQTIKRLRGNPEAVASAYSLYSYEISSDLGGEEAYLALRDQARRFNIRLASDMVPNHMGIDSRWVIEHPDWFIQLNYSPYPSYTFNGPNLSGDDRVGTFIEDHYFDNSDAAVVFKRVDQWTGDVRFIYHGNDGTSMPWNDTAQLNYLNPEVREAVIQTILHVARKFPIIRFDAAMTLAKKHYQRLWYPEPGSGGAIPSRAEHGLSKNDFEAAFPEEFWRMVVDRVAQEAPDTLLLAEAFWLMEGYFVRTLGMHRVYNSAFMNMLRDEKNQEYRLVIKNTLEFDPQILKRYVNFMNNPDERTAVEQFGKGDKYFGICTMMVTMPGLPMFGHGQVDGFAEKYGMEFRYPKWHESADMHLVERHEKEIFPLLRQRYLFAEVESFRLYDFYTSSGSVDEDVFAYSNQYGEQRVLVVYHNKYAETAGWIKLSAAFMIRPAVGEEKSLTQTALSDALGLHDAPDNFIIFRDQVSGLEYLYSSQALIRSGLHLELRAYQCQVFSDFREIQDTPKHSYAELCTRLGGKGVPSILEVLQEYELRHLIVPFREMINPGMINWLIQNRVGSERYTEENYQQAIIELHEKLTRFLMAVCGHIGWAGDVAAVSERIKHDVETLMQIETLPQDCGLSRNLATEQALNLLFTPEDKHLGLEGGKPDVWGTLISALIVNGLRWITSDKKPSESSRAWIDEWLLGRVITDTLEELGIESDEARRNVKLVRVLIQSKGWYQPNQPIAEAAGNVINLWVSDHAARRFLRVHPYDDVLWFNKEAYETLAWWTVCFELLGLIGDPKSDKLMLEKTLHRCYKIYLHLLKSGEESEFQLEKLT